ncbi:MAG: DNA recombination and repair protein RecF [Rhodanobacteraceae bacterium]|nr:MAG: DNA recombination and repair protein RecF [Rhodanobacteraceae bacterium]
MNIELLRADNLRCFEHVSFAPGPGINWLIGPNGAGKTTLLEAAYILSHGRSFRAGGRAAPKRHGANDYLVYAEARRSGQKVKLGLARKDDAWRGRLNGQDLPNLAPLFEACPVVYFGPDSQTLLLGPAEERRGFLDWGVFHVEHASLVLWRAWRRALRQRNALLRQRALPSDFASWEHDMDRVARQIHALRARCLAGLERYIAQEAASLVPELGNVHIDYRAGWDVQGGLENQLADTRDRDREAGFTRYGAHRADWTLVFGEIAKREHLSRGQAKAAALVCTLALTRWLKDSIGEYPLLCLDDLESELDAPHATRVVQWLREAAPQCWLTATQPPDSNHLDASARLFHVKRSACEPLHP